MKKITTIFISLFFLVGVFGVSSVNAQTSTPAATIKNLTTIKSIADKEITRRITSLNNLITRISQMSKLQTESKNALIGSANSQISELTNLKTQIDAESNAEALKAERKSILTQYRIYMLFIPKVHILAAGDRISEITDIYEALSVKLQTKINELKINGTDTTKLQNALIDMNQKYTEARVQIQNAQALVTPLVPDNGDPSKMNGNKYALEAAWKAIKQAMSDLKDARADLRIIRIAIKVEKPTPTPKASSTPSPIPGY